MKGKCKLRNKKESILGNKNEVILKVNGITVNIEYSKGSKSFNECLVNILKSKLK